MSAITLLNNIFINTCRIVRNVVVECPVETIVCLCIYALWIQQSLGLSTNYEYIFLAVVPAISLPLSIHVNLGKRRWYYWASVLCVVPFAFVNMTWNEGTALWDVRFWMLYPLSLIIFLIGFKVQADRSFSIWITSTLTTLLTSIVLPTLTLGGIHLILYTIENLFDVEIGRSVYEQITLFWLCVVAPLTASDMVRRGVELSDGRARQNVFLRYVCTPLLIGYTCIVIIYTIYVCANYISDGTLPEGGVTLMLTPFIGTCIFFRMINLSSAKPIAEWFYQHLPYFCLPALALLWVGIGVRVYEYGLTYPRLFLLHAAAYLTYALVVFIVGKSRNTYWTISVVWAITMFIVTYITPLIWSTSLQTHIDGQESMHETTDSIAVATPAIDLALDIESIKLGEYNEWVLQETDSYIENGCINICDNDGTLLLSVDMRSQLLEDSTLTDRPEKLLIVRNDSLLAVFESIFAATWRDHEEEYYSTYKLFRRSKE